MKETNQSGNMKMNLQFFGDSEVTIVDPANQQTGLAQQTGATQTVDYAKIQQMLDGTLAAKEDTALKAYFKQQGLSQTELDQAIETFKQQKASQQPDVGALTEQVRLAQETADKAQVEKAATITAVSLGLDSKTIPYAIKMADLNKAIGQDGKVNEEMVTNALKQVLEDIPALKPQVGQTTGFVQVGALTPETQQTATEDALKKAFGL